jgi:hypothetical protein
LTGDNRAQQICSFEFFGNREFYISAFSSLKILIDNMQGRKFRLTPGTACGGIHSVSKAAFLITVQLKRH